MGCSRHGRGASGQLVPTQSVGTQALKWERAKRCDTPLSTLPDRIQFLRMYEIFEHTADLGIRVRAGSLDDLFADAARGLFSVMVTNLDAVKAIEEMPFQLRNNNLEELLHDCLAELLYTFYARRVVLADFRVQDQFNGADGHGAGEAID